MKNLFLIISILLVCSACQDKQTIQKYYEESPEIELCKKLVEAYNNQDWETFKSNYCDTAKIWHNSKYLVDPGISPGAFIDGVKETSAEMEYFRFTDNARWEMIIDNDDNRWVHFWGNWEGKFIKSESKIININHIDYLVKDGKIVSEVGYWDNLPYYLETQKINSLEE
ncbi:hypothetical protein ACFLTI_00945 [Bacteroidota bacterium]